MLTTLFAGAMVAALVAKNEEKLYLVNAEKCQVPGIQLDGSTHRRIHFPLLRALAFQLFSRCSSHTISRLTCCSYGVMYGRNTWIINKKMSAKSKLVDDCSPIKNDNLYDRSGGIVLCRNEIFLAATQIRVYFTFIRCCHFASFVIQRYQALGMIFGLMRSSP